MADIPRELRAYYDNYKARFQRQQAEADELQAQADEIKASIAAQQKRIASGPSDPHACPQCFVERGETNIIIAKRAADPDRYDRWGCPKCGFYFDVSAR